jgi:cytochrome c1
VDAAALVRQAAELGDTACADMDDQVRETARQVEARERERAERGTRKRALRLEPGEYVMVARMTRTATKMEADLTKCHSAHRYTIRHLVTDKETVEQSSHLEYYDDEIASTNEAIRSQVAHDTLGFKVSGIGGHEQRMGRWHLLPL